MLKHTLQANHASLLVNQSSIEFCDTALNKVYF
jgi:hypothetical protein